MYKAIKGTIFIWTFICAGWFFYTCVSSFNGVVNRGIITDRVIEHLVYGMIGSLVFMFLLWMVPTAVLGVLAWTVKPDTPQPNYQPVAGMIAQEPSFAATGFIEKYKIESVMISVIVAILFAIVLYRFVR